MIYLTKGQMLFDNPSMVVYENTGYYEDGTPVICASALTPDESVCRYEAKFIAYGSQVYSISDEQKLMEEVLKIDDATLLGKSADDIAVEKIVENIEPVDNVKSKVIDQSSKAIDTSNNAVNTATTTIPVENIPNNTSTTTPEILPEINNPIEEAIFIDHQPVEPQTGTTTPATSTDPLQDVVFFKKNKSNKFKT